MQNASHAAQNKGITWARSPPTKPMFGAAKIVANAGPGLPSSSLRVTLD